MRNVSQKLYDENYFLKVCEGYTSDGSLGSRQKKLLSYAKNPSTIIDIGCGRGEVSKFFSNNNCQVFSIDYSYAACRIFEQNVGDKYPFLRHDVSLGLPWLKDEYFEVAILADVLEHLYDEQLSVLCPEVLRLVKKSGLILIDTPILRNGNSTLHVNVKEDTKEILKYFPNTKVENISWFHNPMHCNIILRK